MYQKASACMGQRLKSLRRIVMVNVVFDQTVLVYWVKYKTFSMREAGCGNDSVEVSSSYTKSSKQG